MRTHELIQQAKELRRIMAQATEIADNLQAKLPEMEEPAMSAQCSVIRHFLLQTERQERLLSEMLRKKGNKSQNGQIV